MARPTKRGSADAAVTVAAPPRIHLDLAEVADGRCFVVGWAIRKPSDDPDVHLRRGEKRMAPLVTFHRPDVIQYFTHVRSPDVDRFDIAYGFVFSIAARAIGELILSVQGFEQPLVANAPGPESDVSFLKRYVEAMQPLAESPGLSAARERFRQLLMPRHAAPAAAAGAADEAAPASVEALLAACRAEGAIFESDAASGEPVALLAIHQRGRSLTHSHLAMLQALAANGYRTVLVNSNPESEAGRDALEDGRIAGLLRRPDHGRDVASWLLALVRLGGRLAAADHVLFCNDSFLGPFDDLSGVLAHRARAAVDFWALTDSWDRGYHLQSSFFALSARCLHGEAFRHFRATYAYPNEREAVVTQGELGLSRALVGDGGATMAVVAPYPHLARAYLQDAARVLDELRALPEHRDALPGETGYFDRPQRGFVDSAMAWTLKLLADLRQGIPRNPQHVFWEALLARHRIPFVKRELMLSNPAGVPGYDRILPVVAATFGPEHAARAEQDMRRGGMRAPVL